MNTVTDEFGTWEIADTGASGVTVRYLKNPSPLWTSTNPPANIVLAKDRLTSLIDALKQKGIITEGDLKK